jgi:hypothetical protein
MSVPVFFITAEQLSFTDRTKPASSTVKKSDAGYRFLIRCYRLPVFPGYFFPLQYKA